MMLFLCGAESKSVIVAVPGGGTVFFLRCRYPVAETVSSFVFSAALCAIHGTCILTFLCVCMRALFL